MFYSGCTSINFPSLCLGVDGVLTRIYADGWNNEGNPWSIGDEDFTF